jgi:hypothetical protein
VRNGARLAFSIWAVQDALRRVANTKANSDAIKLIYPIRHRGSYAVDFLPKDRFDLLLTPYLVFPLLRGLFSSPEFLLNS